MLHPSELLSLLPMDQIVDLLKYVTAVLAVIAPAFRVFQNRGRDSARELEERDERIKAFYEAGGSELSPLRMESAFGAAMGHIRLNAQEIPLILRQRRPTSFMASYLRVRDYIAPGHDGCRFELRSIAARPRLRQTLCGAGFVLYALFGFASVWLLFYLAPKLALSRAWIQFGLTLVLSVIFAITGGYILYAASHLHWAKKLFDDQSDA